jgi:dihydroorotate dehydrogenase electron transfer subunit
MAKRIEDLQITENTRLNKDIFTLELSGNTSLPEMKPGQFAQVKVEGSPGTFLRRPLSIHDVDYDRNTFKLLIQIAGSGTETLSRLKKGDSLNLIYPLGNSFTIPEKDKRVLLAGGGCGVAPLLFLAKYLKSRGLNADILLGYRNRERIIESDEFSAIGNVFVATEDGSEGEKGLLTSHSLLKKKSFDMIYCCGPVTMMKAVANYCRQRNINCEVSLENLMGCGIGACLCCVVGTTQGNLLTCTDGPVFDINILKW